jgi:acyl-CoA thioesterase-1
MADLSSFWRLIARACAACFIVAAAGGCSSTSTSPVTPDEPANVRRVVVLGDSLAVSPSLADSFPAVLQSRIDMEQLPWTVTNAGRSGDTTTGGLQRLDPLIQPDVGVLVVALGANDGLRGVPLDTIEKNLATIIETAQRGSVEVLLCGMETPPTRGWAYTIEFHSVFPRLAARYNVALVPFLLEGVALAGDLNLPDGVHPNAAGARRIGETVWRYLGPILRTGGSS